MASVRHFIAKQPWVCEPELLNPVHLEPFRGAETGVHSVRSGLLEFLRGWIGDGTVHLGFVGFLLGCSRLY